MSAIGNMIERMEEEDLFMQMEMCIKENGWMIKHMDMESTHIMMELCIKVSGRTINSMDMEFKFGLIMLSMLGTIYLEKNMGKESLIG